MGTNGSHKTYNGTSSSLYKILEVTGEAVGFAAFVAVVLFAVFLSGVN